MTMKYKNLAVVILAAGKGTRMKSPLPKALHPVCGKPMVWHLIQRAKELGAQKTVVVAGFQFARVREKLKGLAEVVEQNPQAGSGHAVMQAAGALRGHRGPVLVLYCDTPLIRLETLHSLLDNFSNVHTDCTLLSVKTQDPTGYGRIRRSAIHNRVEKIVEHNDATVIERAIREINVGCYVFNSEKLFDALKTVKKNTLKKEYYLTDVVEILAKEGRVEAVSTDELDETHGINTRQDLLHANEILQKRIVEELENKGVLFRDFKTVRIDADVQIGDGTMIESHTVIEEGSRIGKNCVIGPFARIRGASSVGNQSIIGNFVEIVRSLIGDRVQIKHLSYLGDAKVANGVNVGAGTITANFDGKNKHETVIKEGAQVGSGTILIAPVTVGRMAKTGAGAVVPRGRHIQDHSLVVGVPAQKMEAKNTRNRIRKIKR